MKRSSIGAVLAALVAGALPATAAAQAPGPTLNLSLGAPPVFAPFIPGVGTSYTATSTGVVDSSSADTILTVADPSAVASGHLLNGDAALPAAMQVSGASADGTSSGFRTVPDTSAPATLVTYAGPVSNEALTLTFKQPVAQTDSLRTGSYVKTFVFTLSTDQP